MPISDIPRYTIFALFVIPLVIPGVSLYFHPTKSLPIISIKLRYSILLGLLTCAPFCTFITTLYLRIRRNNHLYMIFKISHSYLSLQHIHIIHKMQWLHFVVDHMGLLFVHRLSFPLRRIRCCFRGLIKHTYCTQKMHKLIQCDPEIKAGGQFFPLFVFIYWKCYEKL